MGRRRKALESALELTEGQYFRSQSAMESYHHLAQTLLDQLVTGECLELFNHLGEQIQVWACYSDFIYRNPEEWPVYMDEREEVAIAGLGRGTKEGKR